jgi:hypothetical protein
MKKRTNIQKLTFYRNYKFKERSFWKYCILGYDPVPIVTYDVADDKDHIFEV